MGTNIIQLADYLVPSYRRPRPARARAAAVIQGTPASWSAMAHRRVAERLARASNDAAPTGSLHSVRVTRPSGDAGAALPAARLRISGRLIDVCAELERLAAAETAAESARRA